MQARAFRKIVAIGSWLRDFVVIDRTAVYEQLTPSLAKSLGVAVSTVYFLHYSPLPDRFAMLMEDLSEPPRSCEQIDQITGLRPDEALAAVDYAAKIHAHYLGQISTSGFQNVRTQAEPDPEKRKYNAEVYPAMYPMWLDIQRGPGWEEDFNLPDEAPFNQCVSLYAHHVLEFYDYFSGPEMSAQFTLNHGDLRADNIMASRDDSTGELSSFVPIDMQTLKACPGEFDLAYLLSQSLTTEQRRATEIDLIKEYHSRMPDGYSVSASLYHFQLFLVYGAARIALISAGESNMQASERGRLLFLTLMTRARIATDDWNCLAAWQNMLERVAAGDSGPPPDDEALALVPPHLLAAMLGSEPADAAAGETAASSGAEGPAYFSLFCRVSAVFPPKSGEFRVDLAETSGRFM